MVSYPMGDMSLKNWIIYSIAVLALPALTCSKEEPQAPAQATSPAETSKQTPHWIIQPEKLKQSTHMIQLGSEKISYTATAGPLNLYDENGKVKATIFFVAYTKIGAEKNRPITFAFNGGPGSSSVWLHLGAFGPKKILTPEEGQTIAPPYRWADNQDSLLDLTDLVFIDPVGTGFSEASKDQKDHFFELENDISSVGDFIRDYITYFDRWLSPKYIMGESYGTTRAAGLGDYLQGTNGIYLNGMVLVSAVLDFETFLFSTDNWLPYVTSLPSYTAAAWYQKKLGGFATLDEAIEKSSEFANNTYAPFLFKGGIVSEEDKKKIAGSLSLFTGIREDLILQKNLRIDLSIFNVELLPGKTVGNFDSRLTGYYTDVSRTGYEEDPSVTMYDGIFTAVSNEYIREELGYDGGCAPYKILNLDVNQKWNFTVGKMPTYVNMMDSIRRALIVNPELKIFVASGIFDLVTTFAGTEYSFAHLNLPEKYYNNVQIKRYLGGHMMYLDAKAGRQLKADLTGFYKSGN